MKLTYKNKWRKPLVGIGVFLILIIGTVIYYQNHTDKNTKMPKDVKTVAQPKPEEKKPEEQPKKEEPEKVETKFPEIIHGPGSKAKGPSNLKYVINASYDPSIHVITSTMSVDFVNNLDVDLNDLYFNVWGNADVFLEKTQKDLNVKVDQLKVNGQPVNFTQESTVLHIPQVSIKKTEKAKVEMNFSVTLPEGQDRFGWYNTTTSLGNWFPILAVYDNEGWNADPYYPSGESFYSLTSDFDVTFKTWKDQVIATTGTEVGKPKIDGSSVTHQYKAVNVRDFAMEMDPAYKIKQAKAGNVNINVYYTAEHAKYVDSMLTAGIKSIPLFSQKFGQYPWPELDICAMEGWFGGMEYPQLVMISIFPDRPLEGKALESVVAHEIGHQWFYGIIGNNEYDEPWIDESFASFAATLYDGTQDVAEVLDPSVLADTHLSASIATFTEVQKKGLRNNYYMVVYKYGDETIKDLRNLLGDKQFFASMQAYFNEMKFGVSSTADFIRIMEQTSKKDLSKFFEDHRVYAADQQ